MSESESWISRNAFRIPAAELVKLRNIFKALGDPSQGAEQTGGMFRIINTMADKPRVPHKCCGQFAICTDTQCVERNTWRDHGGLPPECRHPEHNAPTHIHVEAGKFHSHTCPRCSNIQVIHGGSTLVA